MDIERVVDTAGWAVPVVFGLRIVGKIIVSIVAMRGEPNNNKPEILKAVRDLFRLDGVFRRD